MRKLTEFVADTAVPAAEACLMQEI
jgi:hypothetical protein